MGCVAGLLFGFDFTAVAKRSYEEKKSSLKDDTLTRLIGTVAGIITSSSSSSNNKDAALLLLPWLVGSGLD